MEQQVNVVIQFTFSADAALSREELEKRVRKLFKSLLGTCTDDELFPMVDYTQLVQLREEAEIYGSK